MQTLGGNPNILLPAQFCCVTKFRLWHLSLSMGTARYYPQTFGSTPIQAILPVRGLAYMAAGVAALSALTVFLSLCERDHSFLLSANRPSQAAAFVPRAVPQRPPAVSADPQPASGSVTRVLVPTAPTAFSPSVSRAASTPVTALLADADIGVARNRTELLALERHGARHYVEFTLARSRRLQRVGSVSIGIPRIDARRKLYDISVIADGHRTERKRVALYSPIWVSSNEFARPLQLVVNDIDRDGISGYLSEPAAR